MSADPTAPLDVSAERIANALDEIAEALTSLIRDRLVTQRLNREYFERYGAAR